MAAPSKAWDHQVDDRMTAIASGLQQRPEFSTKEVPGLKNLLTDYVAPEVVVTDIAFVQRLLKVWKDSETDDTYSKHLSKQTVDERSRIERFVAGEDPAQAGDGFVLGPSMGCREELQKLQEATSVVHVSSSGITKVKDDVESFAKEAHHWFHSTMKQLSDFFKGHKVKMDEAGVLASTHFTAYMERRA